MDNTKSKEYRDWLGSLSVGDTLTVWEIRSGILYRGDFARFDVTIFSINSSVIRARNLDTDLTFTFLQGLLYGAPLVTGARAIFPQEVT